MVFTYVGHKFMFLILAFVWSVMGIHVSGQNTLKHQINTLWQWVRLVLLPMMICLLVLQKYRTYFKHLKVTSFPLYKCNDTTYCICMLFADFQRNTPRFFLYILQHTSMHTCTGNSGNRQIKLLEMSFYLLTKEMQKLFLKSFFFLILHVGDKISR